MTITYSYDAPNRVTRKTYSHGVTPEVDYVYDQAVAPMSPSATLSNANGNMIARARPAPNQANPGKTVTTCYGTWTGSSCTSGYDALNRPTRKTYSDGITPEVDFVYDQSSPSIGGVQSLSNANGRLAYAFSPGSSMDIYSYDPMGRTTDMWQCISVPCTSAWHASHSYDLAGDLTSVGYNGAPPLNYQYDNSQRFLGVGSTTAMLPNVPTSLMSSVTYDPTWPLQMHQATVGNNLTETRGYSPQRTWLTSLQVGSAGSVYNLGLSYFGNGDIQAATDVNGNWSYQYDGFNRLSQATNAATNPAQIYQYLYDRFGNRWQQNYTQGPGPGWPMALTFTGNNQISTSGDRYDAAGNVVMDGVNCYTFDAENRTSSTVPETAPGSGVCGAAANGMDYLYDPDGRRVAKLQNGAMVKQFYYDAAGQEIAETNASGVLQRAEIFAGGRHLATWNSAGGGTTYFNHADWLGTERARTYGSGPNAGQVCETISSLPFGDGETIQPQNGGCGDPSPNHFTGKERDSESGLDNFGARYNGSSMGRFMTPDPLYIEAHRLVDPQRLNLYAYARNNPVTLSDPTGLDVALKCDTKASCAQAVKDFNSRKGAQFQVELGKGGKLQVVKGSVANGIGGAEGKLLGAINDSSNHATINVSGNTGQSEFGTHDSKGVDSVDLGNLSKLDATSNAGGLNSGDALAHEAMDAYYSLSMGEEAADQAAAGLYPGLYGPTGNQNSLNQFGTAVVGSTFNQAISNGSGTERVTIQYITPIPAIDLFGRSAAARSDMAHDAGSRVTGVTFVQPKQQ